MKLKFQRRFKPLKSSFTFDRKQALRFCKMEYYKAQAKNMSAYEFIEKEKIRLSTPRWDNVTDLLNFYRSIGSSDWRSGPAKILLGIYNKNKAAALLLREGKNPSIDNTKLISIIANPQLLLMAYTAIKRNKGALSKAAYLDQNTLNNFNEKQRILYFRSRSFPDGISLRDFFMVSELIKKGLYPWGSSSRVYFPKPGVPDKKRPITIPPFMDRIVQKAISMVLEAIYEPYFEVQNRSFGFRPNKGCHDAIVACTSTYTSGKITAIEGDIEAAYDTVNKDKLIQVLSKKITDRKFLRLIRDRLDYDFVEKSPTGDLRFRPALGIPQGGIDSPYLFNIYMKELDDFIFTQVQDYVNLLNSKISDTRKFKWLYSHYMSLRQKTARAIKKFKKELSSANLPAKVFQLKSSLFNAIREARLLKHKLNFIKSEHPNKRMISLLYVRYADDWIILTNGDKQIATTIKEKIRLFLLDNLELKLSDKKTFITDIRKTPAKFLGFELRHRKIGPLVRKPVKNTGPKGKRFNLQRTTGGTIVWSSPDRQRLINRFHMKGFCDKEGFPRELPWLSTMEPHVIIERYNAVIRGLFEYYYGFIRNISSLQRWIYILRMSCIKTLAQKFRTTTKGIFRRFGTNLTSPSLKTIKITVQLNVGKDIYTRDWVLWSYRSIVLQLKKTNTLKKSVSDTFWSIEKTDRIGDYPYRIGNIPKITSEEYLEKISWVSLRTQASFAMPCANCGTDENVHQHHIRQIRKTAYELISDNMPYQKVMALRNRKQIPLCAKCHRLLVHAGTYTGTALIKLVPKKLIDNRMVHVESFVKPGIEYNSKSLIEKGWLKTRIQKDDLFLTEPSWYQEDI